MHSQNFVVFISLVIQNICIPIDVVNVKFLLMVWSATIYSISSSLFVLISRSIGEPARVVLILLLINY